MTEDDGFEAFVAGHADALLRFAVLLTGSADRGEELLQDTLAHLYPQWSKVAVADSPLAYVRRAVANRFTSAARSPRSREVPVWDVPERWEINDPTKTISDRRSIWLALGRLPPRQRAAVVMRFYNDQTDAEIAAVLGCRQVSVRSIVSRALVALRADSSLGDVADKAGSW